MHSCMRACMVQLACLQCVLVDGIGCQPNVVADDEAGQKILFMVMASSRQSLSQAVHRAVLPNMPQPLCQHHPPT